MSLARLNELAKENTLHGSYRGCRLRMSEALSERLRQRYKPDNASDDIVALRNSVFGVPRLYELMGIPIINDISLKDEPLLWVLVNSDGEEIERGYVDAEHSESEPTRKDDGSDSE